MTLKLSAFLFLSFCIGASVVAQNVRRETDLNQRELIGTVHTVKGERKVIENFTGDDLGGWIPSFTSFNKLGYIEKEIQYNEDGKIDESSTSEFDVAGNKIKQTHFGGDGELRLTETLSYDSKGNRVEYKSVNAEGILFSWEKLTFDKEGKGTIRTMLNEKGEVNSISDISYDQFGRVIRESPRKQNGAPYGDSTVSYSFTERERKEETLSYNEKGDLQYRYVDITHKNGDISSFSYNADGKVLDKHMYTYERDYRGNWITEIVSHWTDKEGTFVYHGKVKVTRIIKYY